MAWAAGQRPLVFVTPDVVSHHEELDRRRIQQRGILAVQPVLEPAQVNLVETQGRAARLRLDLVVEGDTLVVTHIDRLSRGLTTGCR